MIVDLGLDKKLYEDHLFVIFLSYSDLCLSLYVKK